MNATPRGLDVVILGAGFSRAVSTHLPLTDELGMSALLRLPARWRDRAPSAFAGGTFETWLSRLADDQPQLSEAENQENRALFAHMVEAITLELVERQHKGLAKAAPSWLYELLSVLHYGRHTAITLNYDILVEAGLQGHALWCNGAPTDPNNPARSSPGRFAGIGDVLGGLPDLRARSGQTIYTDELTASSEQTFQLLKLHGSLDWYWVPGDTSGATLNRSILRPRFETEPPSPQEYANELPGREPFIMPPLAAKSAYFRNPVIREIWRKALAALRRADRIHLVGYSLPAADLMMTGMLQDATRGRKVAWSIVDVCPDGPRERLVRLGADDDSISVFSGCDAVERFAAYLRDRAAQALVTQLRSLANVDEDHRVLVVGYGIPTSQDYRYPSFRVGQVDRVHQDGDVSLQLVSSDCLNSSDLAALRSALRDSVKRVVAVTSNGERLPLVSGLMYDSGAYWCALTPAQQPPPAAGI